MASNEKKQADWLVLLYVAADDLLPRNLAAGTISVECNSMLERLTRTNIAPNVTVVALTDDSLRKKKAGKADFISPAIRILEENKWQPAPLDEEALLLFDVLNEVPELDTGTPRTLAYFIRWALRKYDATKIMLSIIGHGGGWSGPLPPGTSFDPSDNERIPVPGSGIFQTKRGGGFSPGLNGLCPDETSKTALSTPDLRRALAFGLKDKKLDLLFLDACLMGMIEVAYEISDHVEYLVAGESLMWAQLPYHLYLREDNLNIGTDPAELAQNIVRLYNTKPRSRQKSWSIAAVNMSLICDLKDQVEQLAIKLLDSIKEDENRSIQYIAAAYYESQQFDDNADFEVDQRESYIDILDFSLKLAEKISEIDRSLIRINTGGITTAFNDIKGVIGSVNRKLTSVKNNEVEIRTDLKASVELGKPKVILSSFAQTDEDPIYEGKKSINLDNAYGLSIYFPFGDMVEAVENVPNAENKLTKDILDTYLKRYALLRFGLEAPNWVKLLNKLQLIVETTSVADRAELLYRRKEKPAARIVSSPRQRRPRKISRKTS